MHNELKSNQSLTVPNIRTMESRINPSLLTTAEDEKLATTD